MDVSVGAAHPIANTETAEPLIFIEVQRGDYFGEDDIVRLDDDSVGPAAPPETVLRL